MDLFEKIVLMVDTLLWGWPLIIVLLGSGLFMTLRLGFIQFRGLPHGLGLVSGKYDNPDDPGEITHFQALSAALSATIGIGNIAGVATAIFMGGPGALFWMWVTAIVNAPLKYAGICLSHKYRTLHPDGEASGGPMYYLDKGLHAKPLAVGFAFFTAIAAFGIGNMVQSNTVSTKLESDLNIPEVMTGAVLAFLLGLVIIGGIKRIAHVASRLVPVMCVIYIFSAIFILFLHLDRIPEAFRLIFYHAFNPVALTGGFAGTAVRYTLEFGVKRGLFSNESGLGSASIAHAAARTKEAVREGLVGQLGPFIDTIIICSMTGLVIISTGAWKEKTSSDVSLSDVTVYSGHLHELSLAEINLEEKYSGDISVLDGKMQGAFTLFRRRGTVEEPLFFVMKATKGRTLFHGKLEERTLFHGKLTVYDGSIPSPRSLEPGSSVEIEGLALATGAVLTGLGFKLGLGDWAGYIVTASVLLFAFSTAITWSYYGDRSVEYLFGRGSILTYRILFVILYFVGAILKLELVWNLADIANGLMAFPNLIGLILMSGVLAELTNDYLERRRKDIASGWSE